VSPPAVLAAALMVTDVLDIGWGAALGVIGIGLIAMAKWNGLPSRSATRARADAGGDSQMQDDKDSTDRRRSRLSAGAGVAIGTGVGAALPGATGEVFWIPMGIALGAAIGVAA